MITITFNEMELNAMDRPVTLSFPSAVQAIAALEDRIAMLHHDDEAWARRDAQRAVDELRQVFGIRRMTEAELDAAHEAAHIALDELRDNDYPDHADMSVDERPDVPLAFHGHTWFDTESEARLMDGNR
jgi:hypothetical protein